MTVLLHFWASLLFGAIAQANQSSCSDVFLSRPSARLTTDTRYLQVPLYLDNTVRGNGPYLGGSYMGYEFLRTGPIFKNPKAIRELINSKLPPKRNQFRIDDFDVRGQIGFDVGRRNALLAMAGKSPRQPSREAIFTAVRNNVPPEFADELIAYVDKVLEDAHQRGHAFHVFTLVMRTEKYPDGFPEGHNHRHSGDLNYAKAEMGASTEVDSKNRFEPKPILDEDYISSNDRDTVTVFGDIWHRSPTRLESEEHLIVLIELTPMQ